VRRSGELPITRWFRAARLAEGGSFPACRERWQGTNDHADEALPLAPMIQHR